MKLRAILSQQTHQKLKRINSKTGQVPDPGGNKTILVDLLCRTLVTPRSIASRLSALPPDHQNFVTCLAAEGGELLKSDAIEELCKGLVRRFRDMVTALSDVGIVFEDNQTLGKSHPLVGIPDPLLRSIPIAEDMRGRLRSTMKSMSIGLLRGFARQLDANPTDPRRPFVSRAVRDRLLDPEHLKDMVTGMSEEERGILDLMLREASTTRKKVREEIGERAEQKLDEMLWQTPLIYAIDEDTRQAGPIHLATDLRQALAAVARIRGGQLESQPVEILQENTVSPGQAMANAAYLVRDLATLLGFVGQKRPRLLKGGGMAKGSMRDVRRFCGGDDDPGYSEFLMLFVEAVGLVRPEGRYWHVADDAGERLERGPEICAGLLEFWQDSDRWNEWTADRSAAAGRGGRLQELKSVRQEVLKGLKHCGTESWVLYSQFYKMLVRSSDAFRHFAEHPAKGRSLSSGGTTADELVRRMLRGPLMWLGLVDLGNADAFGQPLHREAKAAFRVTPPGHALLMGEPPDPDALPRTNPEARLIIQPTLEVIAPPDLPHGHMITLCGLAQLKSIDVVSHFQVTREAFQRAMNRGMSGEAIRSFLLEASATGLPDIVDSLIRDCERKHGEIEIGPSSGYLTVAREEILDELFAQKQIARSLELRLSPTAAIIRRGVAHDALIQNLSRQGYMPRLLQDSADTEDESHHIVISSSELSDLVAFLETAVEEFRGDEPTVFSDVGRLLRRLRVALRQVPDRHRQTALKKYRRAIQSQDRDTDVDRARQDLLRYDGENPATSPSDVLSMVGYAIDRKLCIEIGYGSETEEGPDGRLVEPFSEDHAMLYAFCRARRGDRVFRLDRIRFARLTAERAQRR